MAKERFLTCIVCPRGCQMKIILDDDGKVESVDGNFCKRGVGYANDECTNPKRVVTTTVMCDNGKVLPVKTDTSIPKDKVFECMNIINSTICSLPVKVGDIIIEDVFGANIVATKCME